MVNIDPNGQEIWGVNLGIGGTHRVKGSYSFQLVFDSEGNVGIQKTVEAGVGLGTGGGVFANIMFGAPDTIYTLEGASVSISGSAGPINASVTVPIGIDKKEDAKGDLQSLDVTAMPRVVEVGIARGRGKEIGVMVGNTETLASTPILGNIGRWISGAIYDLTN